MYNDINEEILLKVKRQIRDHLNKNKNLEIKDYIMIAKIINFDIFSSLKKLKGGDACKR